MKKNLFVVITVLFASVALLTSCGSKSPSSTAKAFLSALTKYDAEGMADYIYLDIDEDDDVDKAKKEFVDGLNFIFGLAGNMGELPEVKGYEVLSEEISEDGETATVEYSITSEKDGEEETEEEELELRKDANGNWKVIFSL